MAYYYKFLPQRTILGHYIGVFLEFESKSWDFKCIVHQNNFWVVMKWSSKVIYWIVHFTFISSCKFIVESRFTSFQKEGKIFVERKLCTNIFQLYLFNRISMNKVMRLMNKYPKWELCCKTFWGFLFNSFISIQRSFQYIKRGEPPL